MKKIVEKEVTFCDGCGEEIARQAVRCLGVGCGAEFCAVCVHTAHGVVTYRREINKPSPGDGHYCTNCNTVQTLAPSDPLFASYRRMEEAIRAKAYYEKVAGHSYLITQKIDELRQEREAAEKQETA